MVIAALPDTQIARAGVVLLFSMLLIFCGVMQPPSALSGFWIFTYRLSPFAYWIGAKVSTQVHGRVIECGSAELSISTRRQVRCVVNTLASTLGLQVVNYLTGMLRRVAATARSQ